MKSVVIVVLVIIVFILGFGGWFEFGKKNNNQNTYHGAIMKSTEIIDLSNRGLKSVGPGVYDKTATTTLILSDNLLTSLPSQMGQMKNLQVLRLDHNQLTGALIAEIRKMPLVELDASYNQMTGIPAEIGQLATLRTLNYSHNKIDTLPNEIYNLKELRTLDLTGNPLSPTLIAKLKTELPNTNIIF